MKTRTINIPRKDVLFDVDSVTHLYARANEAQDLRRADAIGSDSEEIFDEKVITRFADRRAAELRELMSKFLVTETGSSHTVSISSEDNYTFALTVEDAFQDELLTALANEMESYIATGAEADWLVSVGSPQGSQYAQMLPSKLNTIVSYIVKRKIPTRV